MPKPILLAVHEQLNQPEAMRRELTSRYATHYEIICETSPVLALNRLQALRATAEANVLTVFTATDMSAMPGTEFLERAHELHPHAQRVLLIPWSNRSASKPILRMMSQGRFDQYATVPTRAPDENFHYLVTEILRDSMRRFPRRYCGHYGWIQQGSP